MSIYQHSNRYKHFLLADLDKIHFLVSLNFGLLPVILEQCLQGKYEKEEKKEEKIIKWKC